MVSKALLVRKVIPMP